MTAHGTHHSDPLLPHHLLDRLRQRFGVTLLVATLVGTAACGPSGTADLVDRPSTSTTTTTTTPNTTTTPSTTTTPNTTTTPSTTAPTRGAALDELVDVDGASVHIRCTGSGTTTVVLVAGYEGGSEAWQRVEPALSARTRVCSSDRPGTGTSDPATGIATFSSHADDLRDLLAIVGEQGPYVLVGHSFGGAIAVSFASAFTDEVAGLVLVDASPVTWPEALCTVADDGSDAAATVLGLCAGWSDPTGNAEHLDIPAAFADTAAITSLGSLPMTVITAVDRQLPAGLDDLESARLTDVWDEGQRSWSRLSTSSRLVPVDDTSHDIQLDRPDLVIDEIVRLLP